MITKQVFLWLIDARSTYVFIHWEEELKLRPKLKNDDDDKEFTQSLEVIKHAS